MISLPKKGDKSDLGNYRPISFSHLCKTFIKIIEEILGTLDLQQPTEYARFRRGLSTTAHLYALNQVLEKQIDYQLPLYIAFIDYSKVFDSLIHSAIFKSPHNQQIDLTCIHLLQNIYRKSTAVKFQISGPSFPPYRKVKHGDPLSPKFFTVTLEEVFRQ